MLFTMIVDAGHSHDKVHPLSIQEEWFARIGEGEWEAFEALYQASERAIYTYALSLLKNPHDAHDITQETFLKVRASAHLYRPQGKPMAWMFTIARNLSTSLLRSRGRSVSAEAYFLENNRDYSYIQDPTDRLVLAAALDHLDEQERQILLLHVVSGLKHREIAKSLGFPLGTVLSRYHRALKKMRKQMTEGGALHE